MGIRSGQPRLQNTVLRTTGNLPRLTRTHDLHVAFKILILFKKKTNMLATVILIHENVNVRNTGQGEAQCIISVSIDSGQYMNFKRNLLTGLAYK